MTTFFKRDGFGTIRLERRDETDVVVRDTRAARPALRWLARRLASREAAALATLAGVRGVPPLRSFDGAVLERAFVAGAPMHESRPAAPRYFADGLRLLRHLHRRGIAHNDLAKEANWLVTANGEPAVVDFQVAFVSARRGRLFRRLAYEDLRHWLKHKRTYLPERLTARQKAVLRDPTLMARAFRALVKPLYRFVTRGLLGWRDRTGPAERQS
jgi:RIO-like serine/threonine protein kinase